MARSVDHTERKNKILAATVSSYIKNGNPVSSQELAQQFGLSSATMRNIMAELEADGYLVQLHTSAGRIPTDKGYRYYVDFLMGQVYLTEQQKISILNEYKRRINSFEAVLEKTSELIATLTHYAAIVSFSEWDDRVYYSGLSNIVQQPEFHDSVRLRFCSSCSKKKAACAVAEPGDKPAYKVYIGNEIACSYINQNARGGVSIKKGRKEGKKGRSRCLAREGCQRPGGYLPRVHIQNVKRPFENF
jgi:transcriptional regulator of heat shock response